MSRRAQTKSISLMVTTKTRIVIAAAFLLVAGLAPVVALFIEHGARAWLFIRSGHHIFSFGCLLAPIAVYIFVDPLIRLGRHFCSPAWRAAWLALAVIMAGAACVFDYVEGLPQLFEFESSVQDAAVYQIEGRTLWQFYEEPVALGKENAHTKQKYTDRMRQLAEERRRSPAVVVPYYVAMWMQILFVILYVLTLGFVTVNRAARSQDVTSQLFASGLICFPWLPAQRAFIETKGTLYADGGDATSVIFLMGLAILAEVSVLFGQIEKEQRKMALPQITFGALMVLLAGLPQATDSAFQLFSRDAHPARYIVFYLFVLLYFAPQMQRTSPSFAAEKGSNQSEATDEPLQSVGSHAPPADDKRPRGGRKS